MLVLYTFPTQLGRDPSDTLMLPFLQAIIGAIVWGVANIVYLDMKRKGLRGFTRFAAFWAGTPTTWITFFAVREGKAPTFQPMADDDDALLLAEIRRDRALRPGSIPEADDHVTED